MNPGDWNDWIVLGTSVAGVIGIWLRWGRRWMKQRRDDREAIVSAARQVPMMVQTQEKHGKALESLQSREVRSTAEFAALHTRLDRQDESLETIKHRIAGTWYSDPVPQFIYDNEGKNVDLNQAYADMMGVDKRRLMGWGFKGYVADDDSGYIPEWLSCLKDHRVFVREATFRPAGKSAFRAIVRIWPQPEQPPARAWHGCITPLSVDGA